MAYLGGTKHETYRNVENPIYLTRVGGVVTVKWTHPKVDFIFQKKVNMKEKQGRVSFSLCARCVTSWSPVRGAETFQSVSSHRSRDAAMRFVDEWTFRSEGSSAPETTSLRRKTTIPKWVFKWNVTIKLNEWIGGGEIIHLSWQALTFSKPFTHLSAMPFIHSGLVFLASYFIVLGDFVHYHYVSALYSSRLYKAFFFLPLLQAHSFFIGPRLLIKMLNGAL